MSKLLRQIVTSGTKTKSGKKKTIRIALDIEYYEKIELFCERYNRKLNETLKGVLEEFVDEIEKNDPLYHTLIKKSDSNDSHQENSVAPSSKQNSNKKAVVKTPEIKTETKSVPKQESKPVVNPESKSESKSESKPESNQESKSEKKPEKSLSTILLETVKK